ncbi:MAG: hypothetical protein HN675_14310 [Opitutae bacterium]|nr:hypothetical protein [Opitutae bacterium]
MNKLLLLVVGLIYAILGVWCTLLPEKTASALGFVFHGSGIVEYVVVYGGLEIGLGAAMIIGVFNSRYFPGVFFMTTVFSGILPIFRIAMIVVHGSTTTLLALLGVESLIVISLLVSVVFQKKEQIFSREG